MVSVDPLEGEKGNMAFAEEHGGNNFPLLSDPTKEMANAYGVLNAERGFANRWTFYIGKDRQDHRDRQGREQAAGHLRRRHGRHAEAVGRRGEEEVETAGRST